MRDIVVVVCGGVGVTQISDQYQNVPSGVEVSPSGNYLALCSWGTAERVPGQEQLRPVPEDWPAPLGAPVLQGPAGSCTNSQARRSIRSLPKSDVSELNQEGFGGKSDCPKSRDVRSFHSFRFPPKGLA